jgi:hypothetical protein
MNYNEIIKKTLTKEQTESAKQENSDATSVLACFLLANSQSECRSRTTLELEDADGNQFTFEFSQSGYEEYTTYSVKCSGASFETVEYSETTFTESLDPFERARSEPPAASLSEEGKARRYALRLALRA